MTSLLPHVIEADNVSLAWAKTLLHIVDHSGTEMIPLILAVSGFDNDEIYEDCTIRQPLESLLKSQDQKDIETVAFTIFPESVWHLAKGDRHRFYKLYIDALPRWVAMNTQNNGRGLYFSRLISYWIDPKTGEKLPYVHGIALPGDGNQLEYIITQHASRDSVRRSMFQASVFDPGRDHIPSAQLGFPCMQHLSFIPDVNGTLTVNAFYATQQLLWKGYGNYLGICRLGRFMAQQMRLKLGRMVCFVGVEKMEGLGKNSQQLAPLIAAARVAVAISESRAL